MRRKGLHGRPMTFGPAVALVMLSGCLEADPLYCDLYKPCSRPDQVCNIAIRTCITTDAGAAADGSNAGDAGAAGHTVRLTVNKNGSSGAGTIKSLPVLYVLCDLNSTRCSDNVPLTNPPTSVRLTAVPASGSRFRGWATSGDCGNFGTDDCTLVMDRARTITGVFAVR